MDDDTFPPVTAEEMASAARLMTTGKAAGLDGVPPDVIKGSCLVGVGVYAEQRYEL